MESDRKPMSVGASLLQIFFGLGFMSLAYACFTTGKWPILVPPQLDLVAFILGAFNSPIGVYLAGGLLSVLGIWLTAEPFIRA